MRASIIKRFYIYGVITTSLSIGGLLSAWGWLFDLCSHFHVQYATISTIALIVATLQRQLLWSAIIAIGLAINLSQILPSFTHTDISTRKLEDSMQHIVLFNLNKENRQSERIRTMIRATQPEIIVLLELTQSMHDLLALKDEGYTYAIKTTREDSFGIGLYSKVPLVESGLVLFGPSSLPSIVATVTLEERPLHLIASHPLPPSSPDYFASRNVQLHDIAKYVRQRGQLAPRSATMVLMDMNASPWCDAFQRFTRESGLRDSRNGMGLQPSWPSWLPVFLIPIDHIFVDDRIKVVSRLVGQHLGSDHYPIKLDFMMTR